MKTLLLALLTVGSVAHAAPDSYAPSQQLSQAAPGQGYWCDLSYQNSAKVADQASVVNPINLQETSKGVFVGTNVLGQVQANGVVKLVVDTNQNTMTISHVEAGKTLTRVTSGLNSSDSIVYKKTTANGDKYDISTSCGRMVKTLAQ